MFYDFAVTVPAGTAARTPVEATLKLTAGLIIRLDVEFPAGCRGYVSAVIRRGSHQLYPTNPSEALNAENFTIQAWDFYPLMEAPFDLKVYAWSPLADYDHTLTVRVNLVRLEELTKLLPFLKRLEMLMEYMGVPAEVITPGAPAPGPEPEPEPEAPPICALGATKCVGVDLYECQEVDGIADWVLVEEDSDQCQVVKPTEPEPEPPPPPEPPEEELEIPSEGKILEIWWVMDNVQHPLTDAMPRNRDFFQRFKIKNVGEVKAKFRTAYYKTGYGEGYYYSPPVMLEPQQVAYIDWAFWSGAKPGNYEVIWHLFSYDQDVFQLKATHIIAEEAQG